MEEEFAMKKYLKLVIISVIIILGFFNFGCFNQTNTGPIPNGNYGWQSDKNSVFVFTMDNIKKDYGWVIDGDTAEKWVSGQLCYKAKIVKKEGNIYFEGYKFVEVLYSLLSCAKTEFGTTDVYQVAYNESRQSISLTLVVIPSGE